MKISLVTETYPPEVNGVAMTLSRLVNGLSARGHSMQVICPKRPDRVEGMVEGVEIVQVPGVPIPRYDDLRFGLPARNRIMGIWAKSNPDLVHVATEGPLGWSAVRAAEKLGVPMISSFHTNFHEYGSHYGYGFLQRAVLGWLRGIHNRTERTFVPNEKLARQLTDDRFQNVSLLGRGVDTGLFNPSQRSESLRASWGAGPDTPVAMYVGRVAGEKNLPLTRHAWERMRPILPDLKLVVVGDGPERKKLEKAWPEAVFCGMQHGADLATHYASGDIFLFGSRTETFGNVVTEAMASGLAVLAFRYAAPEKFIEHGVSGYLASFGYEDEFVSRAEEAARDIQSWPRLRERAVQAIRGATWDGILDGFEAELNAVVREAHTSLKRKPA